MIRRRAVSNLVTIKNRKKKRVDHTKNSRAEDSKRKKNKTKNWAEFLKKKERNSNHFLSRPIFSLSLPYNPRFSPGGGEREKEKAKGSTLEMILIGG